MRGAFVVVALMLTMAGVARADGPTAAPKVGSYETSGCPSATPIWVFHYDLYWTGYEGATSNEASIQPGVLTAASNFAQDVGILSDCAVRAHVDVFSHSDAYPVAPPSLTGDGGAFLDPPAGYDDEMVRVPVPSETALGYAGITSGGAGPGRNFFPVDPSEDSGQPWEILLMHEWLHSVVAFYTTPLGWPFENTPYPDVHGACNASEAQAYPDGATYDGVPSAGCMVNSLYFHDLMTGNVLDGNQLKGMQPAQWAAQRTPTTLLPTNAAVSVAGTSITFSSLSSAPGVLRVFTTSDANALYIYNQSISQGTSTLTTSNLPRNTPLQACVAQPIGGGYAASDACSQAFTLPSGSSGAPIMYTGGGSLTPEPTNPSNPSRSNGAKTYTYGLGLSLHGRRLRISSLPRVADGRRITITAAYGHRSCHGRHCSVRRLATRRWTLVARGRSLSLVLPLMRRATQVKVTATLADFSAGEERFHFRPATITRVM